MKIKDYISFSILTFYFFIIVNIGKILKAILKTDQNNNLFYIGLIIIILFTAFIYIFLKKSSIGSIFKENKSSIIQTIILSVIVGVIFVFADKIVDLILKNLGYFISDNSELYKKMFLEFKPNILRYVIVMPILYDLIFVNIIVSYLNDFYDGAEQTVRILISAVISSVIAIFVFKYYNPQTYITIIFRMIVSSMLFYKTGRIESNLIATLVYNCISLSILFLV